MMAVLTPWPHLTQYRGPQFCTSMSGALWVLLEPLFLHIWCVGAMGDVPHHPVLAQVISPHWHSSSLLPAVGEAADPGGCP